MGENLVRLPGHPFNLLDDAAMSLFGPTSSTALAGGNGAKALPTMLLDTTPATGGTQVLVLSDTNGTTGGYSFRLLTPAVTTTPLTLGSVVSGSIDVPGEQDRYTFTLTHDVPALFRRPVEQGRNCLDAHGAGGHRRQQPLDARGADGELGHQQPPVRQQPLTAGTAKIPTGRR